MAADRLIAGFTQQRWDLFLAPIPQAFLYKAPVGNAIYVKHQYCVEMLNKAFGVDGWSMEVKGCWSHDQYKDLYVLKDDQKRDVVDENGQLVFREKLGRYFAEAHVRLTICAPGCDTPVYREDIGSHVAASDWSESRKAAVSEALKRAASRFGFASEVYKTEAIEDTYRTEDWEAQILPTYTAPYEITASQLASLVEWMKAVGWSEERQKAELDRCTDKATTGNLAWALRGVLEKARPEARELMESMDVPDDEQEHTIAQIVDTRTAQEILARLRTEAADVAGGGPTPPEHAPQSLFREGDE